MNMDALLGGQPFAEPVIEQATRKLTETTETVDLDEFRRSLAEEDDLFGDTFIDEKVAAAMKDAVDPSFTKEQVTVAQMFSKLSPQQKAAALATYSYAGVRGVGINSPLFIDEKAVPETLRAAFLSPTIIGALGMRGYSRVRRTPETMKWVPNLRLFGNSKWIRTGPYILCAIPAQLKLAQEAEEWQSTNGFVTQQDERFRSALRSIGGSLGLTRKELERRDANDTGIIATRGLDPGALDKPDFLEPEEEDGVEFVERPKA